MYSPSRLLWVLIVHFMSVFCWSNALAATQTLVYSYDENDQINQVEYSDGTTVDYLYDLLGNRYSKTVTLANSFPNQPPNTITDYFPVHNSEHTDTHGVLEWNNSDPDSDDIVIYHIYFGESAEPPLIAISDETSYNLGSLKSLTTYYWKIVAIDNHNNCTEGPVQRFTTENNPPDMPQVLFPKNGSVSITGMTQLGWSGGDPDIGDTVSYDVYFGSSNPPPLIKTQSDDNTYNTQELSSHTTYYWQIVSRDNHGAETAGPVWSFDTLNEEATLLNNVTYASNAVLTKEGGPYVVTGNLRIDSGVTLTIEPGTIIKMGLNSSIKVYGTLNAQGSEENKIIFTSILNDKYGGDCNGDGNASLPNSGDWYGITFYNTADAALTEMAHCIIEYAGYGNSAAIYVDEADISVQHSIIKTNQSYGIFVKNASPRITGNTFSDNGNYDFYATNSDAVVTGNTFDHGIYVISGLLNIENNIIHYNDTYPIITNGDNTNSILNLNMIDNLSSESILNVSGGTITQDTTWPDTLDYRITGSLTVKGTDGEDGITVLTIEPGARILFDPYTGLIIGSSGAYNDPGALLAQGTPSQPITFTSSREIPSPGDWRGITFYGTTNADLSPMAHCVVEYAGYANQAAISIERAGIAVTDSIIRNNQHYGIATSNAVPSLLNNMFSDNGNYDLYATMSDAVVTGNTFNNGMYIASGLLNIENNIIHYNDEYPIKTDVTNTHEFLNLNIIDNLSPESTVYVTGGTITQDTTWPNTLNYRITNTLTVNGTDGEDGVTTLTIAPGATLLFDPYTSLIIGSSSAYNDPGALSAQGTASQPITFTSAQDTPSSGDWRGNKVL